MVNVACHEWSNPLHWCECNVSRMGKRVCEIRNASSRILAPQTANMAAAAVPAGERIAGWKCRTGQSSNC